MNEWVVFKEVVGNMEADIIKGKLEAYEIPVRIEGEAYSRIVGLEHGEMSFMKILIPREYLDRAQKLFEEGS